MLPRIREYIAKYSTPEKFLKRLGLYFPSGSDEFKLIEKACFEMVRDFEIQGVRREGGGPYFTHPLAVAIICLEHLRIRDANIIAAALLHDNVEDLKNLGWTFVRISTEYNQDVSELVCWNTKPDPALYEGDKRECDKMYYENLRRAPRRAVLIRFSDRLHNLLTLSVMPEAKQKAKVLETRAHYLPVAEKHIILIHELEFAIREMEMRWGT
jgi:(p)ppGpp synthase/HD superfamily hydrolase